MAKQVIHIYGASGSGTTTLGRKVSEVLGCTFLDSDDFFWKITNPMYREKREPEELVKVLQEKIGSSDQVVLSGSLVDWGDGLIPEFTLAVRLTADTEVRLARIKDREYKKFGDRILPGGDMYDQHQQFLRWAEAYDTGSVHMRSKKRHDQWQKLLQCPQLALCGEDSMEVNIARINEALLFQEQVSRVRKEAEKLFEGEASGHDFAHTLRVYRNALTLAREEECSLEVVSLASLLHDVDDEKLFQTRDFENARRIMATAGITPALQEKVLDAVRTVSFKSKDIQSPSTMDGMIVQDADRLDALGAIGIARTFAFGGSRGRVMHDPNEQPKLQMTSEEYRQHEGTSVNHFYEKLFLLKDLMHTDTAKEIAEEREAFMRRFLDQFHKEWSGL